ncbi:protein PRY1 [Strongylocentrotus purpuratus]|uniref:SCP domain-containing protein n=1 Tax=Strongylocentrotus purpuratus TaxID=7668 RepID=A0A7M7PNJ3_STRPU|nr:protein PRY1 [Strongylocentrotus purpuratus]
MANLDDFQQAILDAHNKLRSERGVPALAWATDIATTASNWAQNISEKGFLQNSDNQVLGENILMTTEDLDGDHVVLKWLQEENNYDYDNQKWQKGTSRFTQMIWKASTEFGVAKVPLRNKDGFVIVANYRPRGNGNRPGEYQKNVPSRSDDTV